MDPLLAAVRVHQFTDGRSRRERPGPAPTNSCAFQALVERASGEPESGLHGGSRCIISGYPDPTRSRTSQSPTSYLHGEGSSRRRPAVL